MLKVVKIGGKVIDNEAALASFCDSFAALEAPVILVHGGGAMASRVQKSLGHEPVMIEGRRVTDIDAIKDVTMVYSGWCNKHICALLQARGCNALGLSGCDASVIKARRRAPIALSDGSGTVDYGFVGDVDKSCVDVEFLTKMLKMGITPVLCAINHDGQGNLLNTNADTVAQSLASALGAELYCCFEKEGVLADVDDPDSVIPVLSKEEFLHMRRDGSASAGMLPKIENCIKALEEGAASARIMSYERLSELTSGTEIKL